MPSDRLLKIFKNTRQSSHKVDTYFEVYEDLFAKFVGQPVTIVEVGVKHGGSLFMWREYFGPSARIIGIDVDPSALIFQQHGFEIVIGDQGNPKFWKDFFADRGRIDVLIDDGGHQNIQQMATLLGAVDYVNDGGIILIEDVHTNYMPEYGNPSRHSFIALAKRVVDVINSRFDEVAPIASPLRGQVYAVAFYQSLAVFHIDRRRAVPSRVIANNGPVPEGMPALCETASAATFEEVRRTLIRLLKAIPFARRAARRLRARKARRTFRTFFD